MLPFWVDPFRHWDCVNALLSRVCLRVLQNGLERERNEGEASAAVELALELHPEQRIRTRVRGEEQREPWKVWGDDSVIKQHHLDKSFVPT